MFGGAFVGVASTISNAAKSLFNGANKQARQERKAAKLEAKERAKKVKETLKRDITGGAKGGAKLGEMWAKFKIWFMKNWQIIAIIAGTLIVLYFLFFAKRKSSGARRRRSPAKSIFRRSRKGTSAMKARMAKVRAARGRKRK